MSLLIYQIKNIYYQLKIKNMDIEYKNENNVYTWSGTFAGRKIEVQFGKVAGQADSACTFRYGDTVVLSTVVMGKEPREGIDFFPLLVDYVEKLYAGGKIKGSRFVKREGKPSDESVLLARMVDRSIRPLFDENLRLDVQNVLTPLSFDHENDPDILSINASSVSLFVSCIPWPKTIDPIAAVRVGYVDDKFVINPTYEERERATLDIVVSATRDKIVMIETIANEVSEDLFVQALEFAFPYINELIDFYIEIRDKIGAEKYPVPEAIDEVPQDLKQKVDEYLQKNLDKVWGLKTKRERSQAIGELMDRLREEFAENPAISGDDLKSALKYADKVFGKMVRKRILETNSRIDGRKFDEIRSLSVEVGILPRTHGSALFSRGETQALSTVTLGAPSAEQVLDTLEEEGTKRYMHHYNFPGYSVGEVQPMRFPSRREIGHGALAEKALLPVIPDKDKFPYAIRVVTDILSSNGSTSMASVCGSTLSLMDAGVPIKKPVSGIAMGLITNPDNPYSDFRILTDLQGEEDHYGDMDFKVAGTKDGITAVQLDVKLPGLSMEMVKETLHQAKQARLRILEAMLSVIPEPRSELSPYAPRIYTLRINPDKIKDVIGPKGKVISEIINETGVTIDIDDDGLVMVTSNDPEAAQKAIDWVKNITREVKVGEVFQGKVTRIMDFGAFVEILPQQQGLVHISELAPFRVENVKDVVKVGDIIPVKVIEIDSEGRINLSLKQTNYEYPPEVLAKAKKNHNNNFHSNRRNNKHH